MLIFIGDKTYCCFEEYNGVKFSQSSSSELGLAKEFRTDSFEDCKDIVATYHDVNISDLSIGYGSLHS